MKHIKSVMHLVLLLSFALLATGLIGSAIAVGYNDDNQVPKKTIDAEDEFWALEMWEDFPTGQCVQQEPKPHGGYIEPKDFPKKHHLQTIGRLAQGIAKQKYKNGWWICGTLIEDKEQIAELSQYYAYKIVRYAWEVSGDDDDPEAFQLSAWGFAGVIKNESNFDRCALGLNPRLKAYELGILKRRKRCISHTEEEVIAVVTHPLMQKYFKRSGFDIGLTQLLSKTYSRPNDYHAMLQVDYGLGEGAREMRHRARWCATNRPWACWPTGNHAEWYDEKITKRAKRLGAQRGEI